jgi:CheY-like chemotaxis protein
MFLFRSKKNNTEQPGSTTSAGVAVLLVDDDPEQLEMLGLLTLNEIQVLLNDVSVNERRKRELAAIKVIKVGDQRSLRRVVEGDTEIVLTVLDCNLPEKKGESPIDQFEKKNHVITGQHRSVDIILANQPAMPILLVSTFDRFRNLVINYYKGSKGINLGFVKKNDPERVASRIRSNLEQWARR